MMRRALGADGRCLEAKRIKRKAPPVGGNTQGSRRLTPAGLLELDAFQWNRHREDPRVEEPGGTRRSRVARRPTFPWIATPSPGSQSPGGGLAMAAWINLKSSRSSLLLEPLARSR